MMRPRIAAAARARRRQAIAAAPRPPRSRRCGSASSAARPSCRTCCAASPSSRPRSAAPSAGPPTRRARRSRRRSRRAPASSRRRELDARLAADRVDVTLPGAPPQPVGRLHLLTATRREIEDVFIGLGFNVVEGPEIETVYYNFDALNHDADAPARGSTDTFYVADDVRAAARTPRRCRCGRWRPSRRRSTSSSPAASTAGQRRHPHAAVPPGRGPGGRRGHHARRPAGHAAGVRARDLRRRPRGPPAPALLPVHRAVRRGRRVLLQLQRQGSPADGSRCPLCKGAGWIEILGAGMVDPNVFGYVREHGYDPEQRPGLRLRAWGSSGSRCSSTASPTCGCSTRTTCASWSSSDESPARLAARVLRPRASTPAALGRAPRR